MQSPDKIKAYVQEICQEIRWKKAHPRIAQEMEDHVTDQRDAYLAQGMDLDMATEKAIADTGEAAVIGTQLDRTHRPKPQWTMLALTGLLMVAGVLIQLLLLSQGASSRTMSLTDIVMTMAVPGTSCLLIAYFTDFTLLGKYPRTFYFCTVLISFLLLILAPEVNGRKMFFVVPSFSSANLALLYPLVFSGILYTARNKGYGGLILCGFALVPLAFLCLTISIVSFLLLVTCSIFLLCLAIWKNWFGIKRVYGFLLLFVPIGILAFVLDMQLNVLGSARFRVALNPSIEPNGMGYMASVTRALLKSARFFGPGEMPQEYVGVGQTIFPLPSVDTDCTLTYIIFTYGWLVFFILMGILFFFIFKGFQLCLRQKSGLGLFVSAAVLSIFSAQAFGYVIYNLGLQFLTPLSLPLLSYGKGAMLINMGLIGFMLSVFRTGDLVYDRRVSAAEKRFFVWDKGKLTIYFKT